MCVTIRPISSMCPITISRGGEERKPSFGEDERDGTADDVGADRREADRPPRSRTAAGTRS